MILIVGIDDDNVIKTVVKDLIEDIPNIVFLNLKKITASIHIYQDYFTHHERKYYYDEFNCAFVRLSDINPIMKYSEKYLTSLNYLIYILNYRMKNVINRPIACNDNSSKLHQLTRLQYSQLKTPRSIIKVRRSIAPEKALADRHIFKSNSAIRSEVIALSSMENTPAETGEPVLFQELINGNNIRVHIVGNQLSAIAIKSRKIDYRYDYDEREFEMVALPPIIKNECIDLAEQSNLLLCGVDLIQVKDDYFLLEANPTPAFTFFERELGKKPITQLLKNFIISLPQEGYHV